MSKVVAPIAVAAASDFTPARRPEHLDGGTLGVLINGKEYSDPVLRHIAELLAAKHDFAAVRFWDKGFPAKPAPFIEEVAANSTFVLNGVGH